MNTAIKNTEACTKAPSASLPGDPSTKSSAHYWKLIRWYASSVSATSRAEQKIRFDLLRDNENLEIEPIQDQPPLPPRPGQEFYDGIPTPQGAVALDKRPKNVKTNPLPQKPPTALDAELLFRNFAERMETKYGTY